VADKQIRRALETIDGVGWGRHQRADRYRQINLYLDLNKMEARTT